MPAANASPAPLAPTMALAGSATEPSARRDPSRAAHDRALRKVRRRPTQRAKREHVLDRAGDRGRIGRAVGAPRVAPGERADLVVVDDEPIEMRQAGAAELGQPIGPGRHQFEIGRKSGGARLAQHGDPAVGVAAPRAIHDFMRARQAEMQDSASAVEEKSKSSGDISAATP